MFFETIFNSVIKFFTSFYFGLFVAVLLTVAFLVRLYLVRNFGKWEKKYGFKGLKPVPFFGTEKETLLGMKTMAEGILEKYQAFEGHKFGIIYQGSRPAIFIRDLELLKRVRLTDFDYFADLFEDHVASSVADNNLFFLNGEKWKKSKAALSQVFRNKHVKEVLPKITISITKFMKQLESFAKTGEDFRFDDEIIELFLLDAVGHSICGVDFGLTKDSKSEIVKMTRQLQAPIWRFLLLNLAPGLMSFFKIKVFDPAASEYLDNLLRQLMKEHKDKKIYDDMLGVLVKAKEEIDKKTSRLSSTGEEYIPLTDDMIRSASMQFFFDGVATVAQMLNVAIFYLAKDQELQEKAFDEIQTVLGDRLSPPEIKSFDDLPPITDTDLLEMKLIDQIFSEASRIGTFPFVWRSCSKDYPMPGTNFVVPKGTMMLIPIVGYHMDPNYFPEPHKFRPERFAPENKDKIVNGSFCPFGLGPRMCLGMNFIRMEGKAFLANLLRSYRINTSDKTIKDLQWDSESGNRIKGGLYVKVLRREN